MGKSAILAIRIIGDATDAVTALDKVDGSAKSMSATMDKAAAGATVALGLLSAAAWTAGQAASELQQAAGAVDSVYGEYADTVHGFAESAAQDVGLATSAYSNMAAIIGAQLKNMGVPLEDVAGQSSELISLGADLAATFGGTTADAVAALSSLLRGERDPIERYGVSIKAADVEAQKAAMGLSDLTGEADAAATTQATLALLTRQTADAQGQFARESDTAAGSAQIAAAEWENASAALGEQLLPLMADGAEMLADLAGWMGENSEVVTLFAGGIGVLAAAIILANGALKAYAAVQAIQTAAQWAMNAAWLANPITWVVLAIVVAIGLIIAIVVLWIQNWEHLSKVTADVWEGIIGWIEDAIGWFEDLWGWISKLANDITPGWIKDLMGMENKSVTARMVTESPVLSPATLSAGRMLFSAEATASGFAQPSTFAAASTAAPAVGLGAAAPSGGDTYEVNIEFNGLVTDPDAVAAEIRKILRDDALRQGRRRPQEANAW